MSDRRCVFCTTNNLGHRIPVGGWICPHTPVSDDERRARQIRQDLREMTPKAREALKRELTEEPTCTGCGRGADSIERCDVCAKGLRFTILGGKTVKERVAEIRTQQTQGPCTCPLHGPGSPPPHEPGCPWGGDALASTPPKPTEPKPDGVFFARDGFHTKGIVILHLNDGRTAIVEQPTWKSGAPARLVETVEEVCGCALCRKGPTTPNHGVAIPCTKKGWKSKHPLPCVCTECMHPSNLRELDANHPWAPIVAAAVRLTDDPGMVHGNHQLALNHAVRKMQDKAYGRVEEEEPSVPEHVPEFVNAIGYYIGEWKDGDDPIHTLGHIQQLLEKFPTTTKG